MKYIKIAEQWHGKTEFQFEGNNAVTELFTHILNKFEYPRKNEQHRIYYGAVGRKAVRISQYYADPQGGRPNCRLVCEEMQTENNKTFHSEKVITAMRSTFSKIAFREGNICCDDQNIFEHSFVLTIQCMPEQLLSRCLIAYSKPGKSSSSGLHPLVKKLTPADMPFLCMAFNVLCKDSGISNEKIRKAFVFAAADYRSSFLPDWITVQEIYQFVSSSGYEAMNDGVSRKTARILLFCLQHGIELSENDCELLKQYEELFEDEVRIYFRAARNADHKCCRLLRNVIVPDANTIQSISDQLITEIDHHLDYSRIENYHQMMDYLFLAEIIGKTEDIANQITSLQSEKVARVILLTDIFHNMEQGFILLQELYRYADLSIKTEILQPLSRLVSIISKKQFTCQNYDFGMWIHELFYYQIPIVYSDQTHYLTEKEYLGLSIPTHRISSIAALVLSDRDEHCSKYYSSFYSKYKRIGRLVKEEVRKQEMPELKRELKIKFAEMMKVVKEIIRLSH